MVSASKHIATKSYLRNRSHENLSGSRHFDKKTDMHLQIKSGFSILLHITHNSTSAQYSVVKGEDIRQKKLNNCTVCAVFAKSQGQR